MSEKEFRISALGFDTQKRNDEFDTFSIGSESCAIKFIMMLEDKRLLEYLKQKKSEGKQIKIVTPFVPERHLNKMKKLIKECCEHDVFAQSVIVVNDLGLMHYIHKMNENIEICIGRNLILSFDYAPWGKQLFESETDEIQKVVSQINFYDYEKMDFFRNYHVTEIEVNVTEGTIDSLKEIKKNGFKVNAHKDFILYGIQRSCYIRRRKEDVGCIGTECETIDEIELDQLWSGGCLMKPSEKISFPNPLFLQGNQIEGRGAEVPYDWCDSIIVDAVKEEYFKGVGAL